MALTPHPTLDGYYESSHGGWAFSIKDDEDGSIEVADEAIAAWQEWREFLIRRESEDGIDPLV